MLLALSWRDTPLAGRIREDLTALPLRFWLVQPYRNYLIVYRPETKPLQVIRIIHAGAKHSADIEVGQGGCSTRRYARVVGRR